MRIPKQLAIRDLLGVTTIIAIWLAIYFGSPAAGLLYFGTACTCCAALVLRKPSLFFFLPLAFSSNFVLMLNIAKMYSVEMAVEKKASLAAEKSAS